jgi:hypothetical protein
MSLDVFASETGYYTFAGQSGSSPDIHVTIGETYIFDQSDPTNWYHPVGFAYEPDGAHGSTWGGDELDEVEGAGELLYKIDGAATSCPDAGATGLDCYEPEFFYPRADWKEKTYTAELTITQDVADRSHGGVLYYFCHIHSKMSGKLVIHNTDGSRYTPTANPTELPLYSPVVRESIDFTCGTTGVTPYTYGQAMACDVSFLCGDLDTVTNPLFGQCLQGVDCAMNKGMFGESTPNHISPLVTFMEQMIPHHLNAINMAKMLMKIDPDAVAATDDLEGILWEIVNVQNYQVHQFRNYLEASTGFAGRIAPGEACKDDDMCANGYECLCAQSCHSGGRRARSLLFAQVPCQHECKCERKH